MLKLCDNDKLNILLKVYEFMFSEMQEFRAKMLRLVLAYNGVLIIMVGWLFNTQLDLTLDHKILLSIGVLTVLSITLIAIKTFKSYFLNIAKVINKIDHAVLLYEGGQYVENATVFPDEWDTFGKKTWKEPVFDNSRLTIYVTTIFVLLLVWFLV
ncbi:hypothetical protein CEE37_05950 [candidate division LCP-89 bacterium B3_LCP]|uniref:Uncharacterized protein n=1 Tax=candidate division LCP-89 bacterium B3_LCP TaxID=2012998 RepID=A0A532V1W8_UNCL8|nr:MAG: hypothetical protein CEE37_05950 [candidate division LCP-89 bacterium B3_LCP]